MTHLLSRILARLNWRRLGLRAFHCPACGPSLLLRLDDEETAVRCMRCRSSAVTLSILAVLRRHGLVGAATVAYETASRGPLLRWLKRHCDSVLTSEFIDGVRPGEWQNGVQCQDLEALTYRDRCVDLVTASEVFEHVADDVRAFAETYRILRPGGALVVTVPLDLGRGTVERACRRAEGLVHLLPPCHHGDRLRGEGAVLVFRDYGHDLPKRLIGAGFQRVDIDLSGRGRWFGHGRAVIVARRLR